MSDEIETLERDELSRATEMRTDFALPSAENLPAVVGRTQAEELFMPVPVEQIEAVAQYLYGMAGIPKFISESLPTCRAIAYRGTRWRIDPVFIAEQAYQAKAGGPLGYQAQLLNAVILANGPFRARPRYIFGYGGDGAQTIHNRFCKVFFFLTGEEEPIVVTSPTVAQIRVKNSPLWFSDPDQQLSYYTVRNGARRHFPDVLAGAYTVEEVKAILLDETPKRTHSLFEEDDPPPEPIDAEFTGLEPTDDDLKRSKRQEAKATGDGGDSRDPRDNPANRPQTARGGPSALQGHGQGQSPGSAQAAAEPPPAGTMEPDDMPEVREWLVTEQGRILAMTTRQEAVDAWNAVFRDKRYNRLRTYDPGNAKLVRDKVAEHIQGLA